MMGCVERQSSEPDLQKWTSNGVGCGLETYISSYHGDQREDLAACSNHGILHSGGLNQLNSQEMFPRFCGKLRPSLIYSCDG
jgi:hypothetical protein